MTEKERAKEKFKEKVAEYLEDENTKLFLIAKLEDDETKDLLSISFNMPILERIAYLEMVKTQLIMSMGKE